MLITTAYIHSTELNYQVNNYLHPFLQMTLGLDGSIAPEFKSPCCCLVFIKENSSVLAACTRTKQRAHRVKTNRTTDYSLFLICRTAKRSPSVVN